MTSLGISLSLPPLSLSLLVSIGQPVVIATRSMLRRDEMRSNFLHEVSEQYPSLKARRRHAVVDHAASFAKLYHLLINLQQPEKKWFR